MIYMRGRVNRLFGKLSFLAQFSLLGLLITLVVALVLSWALQLLLVNATLRLEARGAADHVALLLQDVLRPEDFTEPLSPERLAELDRVMQRRLLHPPVARIKLWNPSGTLVYSDNRALIGRRYPLSEQLRRALAGEVVVESSLLDELENEAERALYEQLIEVYVPVYLPGVPEPVGVYEVYYDTALIQPIVRWVRIVVWTGVVGGFLVLYIALFGLARRASRELRRQADENARLARERERANLELQQALQFREEIIQNVSHELRTPLTLIQGFAEVLYNRLVGELNPEQTDAVRSIRDNTVRLRRMVDLLLESQRATKPDTVKELIDLADLVAQIVEAWEPQLRQRGYFLNAKIEAQPLPVMADSAEIWQVLDNLLDNARKFSPRGTTITVRVWREGDEARIAVRDEGIGLTPEQRERVFERFYQVSQGVSRRYGGLGLGLALCRQIIEAHDGRIWVESQGEGQGSTFVFALPLASHKNNHTGRA